MVEFEYFTVQHECIPQAVLSMDVLCQAKSGMGKTAVFVISTLQQIQESIDDVSVNTYKGGNHLKHSQQLFTKKTRFVIANSEGLPAFVQNINRYGI